jgi:hypothetical protein
MGRGEMARPGLEPGTPRFSGTLRPIRSAVRYLAKRHVRWHFAPPPVTASAARTAEIPADTRRCRGVWPDERGSSAQTKEGAQRPREPSNGARPLCRLAFARVRGPGSSRRRPLLLNAVSFRLAVRGRISKDEDSLVDGCEGGLASGAHKNFVGAGQAGALHPRRRAGTATEPKGALGDDLGHR